MRYDALYGRQSLEKRDSISIESQLEYCRYETHGHPFLEYTDKGFSGKDTHRPGFEQMIKDISAGKIQRVIVYKLDRISRSILDFANMMDYFQTYQVEFVSSTEKFDTSTPIGRAMLNICIVFAQLERETIQKRVKDAYYTRSRHGFYMGGRIPYGFRLKETVLNGIHTSMYEEIPEEGRQIRLIYSMYADPSCSLGDILCYFKEHNIQHLRGSHWNSSRLSDLLKNPIYVKADLAVYRFFRDQGAYIQNPASDFTGTYACYLYKKDASQAQNQNRLAQKEVVLAPHEGLIPSQIWLACQSHSMNNRQSAKTGKARHSWLSGKVKCKNCGYALTIRKSKTKWGRYFVCSRAGRQKQCQGTCCTIYADMLEEYIANAIQNKLVKLQEQNPAIQKIPSQGSHELSLALIQIEEEISGLLAKVPQANQALMSHINDRVAILHSQHQLLEKQLLPHSCPIQNHPALFPDPAWDWNSLSFAEKQSVVDLLIKVIHIGNETMEIQWRIS